MAQAGRPQRAPVTLPARRITGPHHANGRYDQRRLPKLGAWFLHGYTHSTTQRGDQGIHVGLDAWNLTARLHRHHRPNTQRTKLVQPPRGLPRGVVEPSSGRRGSPTATETGSCGVGDLHSARHDPTPSAATGAISPPHRTGLTTAGSGGAYRSDCPHPASSRILSL